MWRGVGWNLELPGCVQEARLIEVRVFIHRKKKKLVGGA